MFCKYAMKSISFLLFFMYFFDLTNFMRVLRYLL